VVTVEVAGEELWLLPEKALYWPAKRTLVVADLHIGKAAAFRAGAIAVPEGTTRETLARLELAIGRCPAERLLCLGDLLHAPTGRAEGTMAAVAEWRLGRPDLQILLVRGNHDLRAGDPPESWDIKCADEPVVEGPFVWRHRPEEDDRGYVVAGHLHPAVRLTGRGRTSVTLPCFYLGRRLAILPAFGSFTGTATVRPKVGERVYVVAEGEVIAVGTG
jgi:DNA ligase-associated metallophosphoesterase